MKRRRLAGGSDELSGEAMPPLELIGADAVVSASTVAPLAGGSDELSGEAMPPLGIVAAGRSGVPGGGPPGEPGAPGRLLSMRTVKPTGTHTKRWRQQGQRKVSGCHGGRKSMPPRKCLKTVLLNTKCAPSVRWVLTFGIIDRTAAKLAM